MFLAKNFPEAILEATPSTAYAAKYIAEHPELPFAAIAPKLSAEMYDLIIVEKYTRFIGKSNPILGSWF